MMYRWLSSCLIHSINRVSAKHGAYAKLCFIRMSVDHTAKFQQVSRDVGVSMVGERYETSPGYNL